MGKTRTHIDVRCALMALLGFSVGLLLVGGPENGLGGWLGLALFAAAFAAGAAALRANVLDVARAGIPLYALFAFVALAHIPHDMAAGRPDGAFYALRLLLLAAATLAVGLSYDDNDFARAFQWMLAPLRKVGAPVDDIASTVSIALRFIPVSLAEYRRMQAAQASRGASFGSGGPVARTMAHGRAFVPVLAGLFRRAATLAQAMDARCYGAGPRTSLGSARMPRAQLVVCAALSVSLVMLGVLL